LAGISSGIYVISAVPKSPSAGEHRTIVIGKIRAWEGVLGLIGITMRWIEPTSGRTRSAGKWQAWIALKLYFYVK
jgi:hypothetical protein